MLGQIPSAKKIPQGPSPLRIEIGLGYPAEPEQPGQTEGISTIRFHFRVCDQVQARRVRQLDLESGSCHITNFGNQPSRDHRLLIGT